MLRSNIAPRTTHLTTTLREEILSQRLKPGQGLPSEKELCARFQVSRITVRRGIQQLKDERLVLSRAGVGHFVRSASVVAEAVAPAQKREVYFVHHVGEDRRQLTAIQAGIFEGIEEESSVRGLDVFLCALPAERLIQFIPERERLAGLLFDWNDAALAGYLLERRIPFVVVEGDFDELPVGSVVQDNIGGTRLAMEHLAAQGHRRIGFIGAADSWIHGQRRLAGYREFHLRLGLPMDERCIAIESMLDTGGQAPAARLLALEPRPTALYVSQRRQLAGVLAAAGERGLRVPQDLSVVVWGDPALEDAGDGISYLSWERRELGRLALRMLDDRARRGLNERMALLVPVRLMERGSVVPPAEL